MGFVQRLRRAGRLFVGGLLLALLAACAQIEVSNRPVEPVVRSVPVPADWDATSARDLHLESAHALRQSLLEPSTRIEAIDADAFWAAADPTGLGRQPMRISEIVAPAARARLAALGIRFLIVLAPLTGTQHELTPNPFYARDRKTTTRSAVLVDLASPGEAPTRIVSVAIGESRDVWFPGGPLLFARLHSTADTEGSALKGLGRALSERIQASSPHDTVRLAILPEP
ncbi:MAG: hypothetical protein KJ011_18765 [Burkholderiaceae bacterium]|nr:hypothetical protein [Burkholderiaceae bacterium]